MIETLSELLENAGGDRDNDMPSLYVVGNLDRHAKEDMVVMTKVGRINSTPVFRLRPRIWNITDDDGIEICDDYKDWLELNDEKVVFPPESIDCVIVANPANDNFSTQESNWKFVTYPPVLEE